MKDINFSVDSFYYIRGQSSNRNITKRVNALVELVGWHPSWMAAALNFIC